LIAAKGFVLGTEEIFYPVENTGPEDLDFIFGLFDRSIAYQEAKGYPVWKNYDKNALVRDVEVRNQYKIIVDAQIGIVFSVRYGDKVIWREMDQGNAIYLHRIVVNPALKGQRLFERILSWAKKQASQKGLRYIRMDTWANNPTLISYYKGYGFDFVDNFTTPDSPELPFHNRNLALALLELKL